MHPDRSLSLAVGALITLAFVALAIYIVHSTPANTRARVLTAAATLMAALPAVLLAMFGR
jgi:ABC-type phosphate transport system permease subunit